MKGGTVHNKKKSNNINKETIPITKEYQRTQETIKEIHIGFSKALLVGHKLRVKKLFMKISRVETSLR